MTTLSHTHALPATPETVSSLSQGDGLVRRLLARDVAALAELTQRFGSAITQTAYLQLGDAHTAEDVAQDTLLAAWDGIARKREETELWPWLLGITYNRCRKHWRSLSRRRRREQVANDHRLALAGEEQASRDDDRLSQVRVALTQMSPKLRIVVILRYFEGLSVRETAESLRLPQGTVKRRCHVAVAMLREQITEVPS